MQAAEELRQIAEKLSAAGAAGDTAAVTAPMAALRDAAAQVGRSSSGSWHHSNLYYKGFGSPSPLERTTAVLFSGIGDSNWLECNPDDVIRTKTLTVVGVAGALSLAGGASGAAVGPQGDTLTANTVVTLHEEEISDVSLSTFYVFDHENAGARRLGLRLAQRSRSRPRQGSAGGADDCAGGGPTCCASCRTLNGGCQ